MKDWHKLKPELFKKNPYYLTRCDIYSLSLLIASDVRGDIEGGWGKWDQ